MAREYKVKLFEPDDRRPDIDRIRAYAYAERLEALVEETTRQTDGHMAGVDVQCLLVKAVNDLAKAQEDTAAAIREQTEAMKSPAYMAPEQAERGAE